jgi:hypothetical protein
MSHPILAAILLMSLPLVFACESPPSYMAEKFGDSVADAREQMLAEREPPPGPEGMEGTTASGVVENYHYNQNYENRQQAIKETGLVDMDKQ